MIFRFCIGLVNTFMAITGTSALVIVALALSRGGTLVIPNWAVLDLAAFAFIGGVCGGYFYAVKGPTK